MSTIDPSDQPTPPQQSPLPADPKLQEFVFEMLMREYEANKNESTARIGFRDNLLYVNLAAVGAVFAYALGPSVITKDGTYVSALLVIPWVTVILGWTYLVNDHHISRLGRFVREEITNQMYFLFPFMATVLPEGQPRIVPQATDKPGILKAIVDAICSRFEGLAARFRGKPPVDGQPPRLVGVCQWEPYHRSDPSRVVRKHFQTAVDLITFPGAGAMALFVFQRKATEITPFHYFVMSVETVAFILLALWIGYYADVARSIISTIRGATKQPAAAGSAPAQPPAL